MNSQDPADDGGIRQLVTQTRAALAAATAGGPDASTVEALGRCAAYLEGCLRADAKSAKTYAGFIDYTIDDEDFESHFRQFDLRVYYSWEDYDRNDEPFASWGAHVEHCEVLAVRYYDVAGNELSSTDYHLEEALDLIEQREQLVTEACTSDGYRQGVGQCHPLYSSASGATSGAAKTELRMAPSARTRSTSQDRRHFG